MQVGGSLLRRCVRRTISPVLPLPDLPQILLGFSNYSAAEQGPGNHMTLLFTPAGQGGAIEDASRSTSVSFRVSREATRLVGRQLRNR